MIEFFEYWFKLLTSLDFWIDFIDAFKGLGPAAPIFLAMIESLIPALPLVAIVTFNITAYGTLPGFLYSWIGSITGCFIVFNFFRHVVKRYFMGWIKKHHSLHKGMMWVARIDWKALFVVALFPFTPSVFLNIVFGLSDFDSKLYFKTLVVAKVGMMAGLSLFGSSVAMAFQNPLFLIPAALILTTLYLISKYVTKKHGL